MKEINIFMGFELPKNISYEVFVNHVNFYRRNSYGEWNLIDYIITPYETQPLSFWKTELDKILVKY